MTSLSKVSETSAGGASAAASTESAAIIDTRSSAIFLRAKAALEETLSHGIVTMQKILPCTVLYGSSIEDLEANYARVGPQLLEVIDHTTRTNYLRNRFLEKLETLEIHTALTMAVFAKAVRHGACQELSIICSQSDAIAPFHRYNYHLLGSLCSDGRTNDHSLLVISESPLPIEKPGDDFITFIAGCKDACVIDPYLEKIVHSQDILLDYEFAAQLSCMRNTKIKRSIEINKTLSTTFDDPRLVALEAYLRTLDADSVEPPATVAAFLYAKRKELILRSLHTKFSDLTWKISSKNQVWTQGSLARLTDVKAELTAKSIACKIAKVEGKEEYCLLTTFTNYKELKALTLSLSN